MFKITWILLRKNGLEEQFSHFSEFFFVIWKIEYFRSALDLRPTGHILLLWQTLCIMWKEFEFDEQDIFLEFKVVVFLFWINLWFKIKISMGHVLSVVSANPIRSGRLSFPWTTLLKITFSTTGYTFLEQHIPPKSDGSLPHYFYKHH